MQYMYVTNYPPRLPEEAFAFTCDFSNQRTWDWFSFLATDTGARHPDMWTQITGIISRISWSITNRSMDPGVGETAYTWN